jgi:hypothetical protein
MKLKLDDKGQVVVQDGKPVYVADDGKEIVFDYPATLQTISRLIVKPRDTVNARKPPKRLRRHSKVSKIRPRLVRLSRL